MDGRFALVANVDASSATLVEVRRADGGDAQNVIAEVGVGEEPRFVTITPDDQKGYVSNGRGDVSVLDLSEKTDDHFRVINTIRLRGELRGVALSPSGGTLYVANFSDGLVHRIDTETDTLLPDIPVGGHPYAIAVTNNGNGDDDDETVLVSDFFSELDPLGPGEGFDTGRRGVIFTFPVGSTTVSRQTVSALSDCGFTADRTAFATTVFAAPAGTPNVAATPQGCHPNQLHALLVRGNRVYSTSIAAAPEPPVIFNNNIQALVSVLDATSLTEVVAETVNLNALVKVETQPLPATNSLVRLFLGDLVDLAATEEGKSFLAVSRSGNYVVRASLDNGKLTLDNSASKPAVRIPTGWLPTGAVINPTGDRAYIYNEGGASITAINLQNNGVIALNIPTAIVPTPGSLPHAVLWGKLAFFTSLGTPNDGLRSLSIRDVNPLAFRDAVTGKGPASDNGWSSCASCHPGGLSDNVTWSFGDGPRQTLPLDATFSKMTPLDRRSQNWSAVRDSVVEFNNNSRGVQGGLGFADDPTKIFNHGFTQGVSEALDDMTSWVQTVRTFEAPSRATQAFNAVFIDRCASCHGGSKWTKSTIFWADDPAFPANPSVAVVEPYDPGITLAPDSVAFPEPRDSILSYTRDANGDGAIDAGDVTLNILENVGTFDPMGPREIRGQGLLGRPANGASGLGVALTLT
jgi:YVTN family beta-propeller protein